MKEKNFVQPEKIGFFKLWLKQTFPFIEETFEALDIYGLLSEMVKYLNDVIKNLNINEDNISYLNDNYIKLQEFVDHYFDNLDVQTEINNKLDEMAKNGELDNIFQPFIQNLENRLQNEIESVNSKVDAVASGSPAGTYDTLAHLKLTNPPHNKIYVVKENNNWYYFDVRANDWISGGVYLAEEVLDNSITRSKLKFAKFGKIVGNNKLTLTYDTTDNSITATSSSLLIQYEDKFFTTPSTNISHEIPTQIMYLCAVDGQSKYIDMLSLSEFGAMNAKNIVYILGIFYQNKFYNVISENNILINGYTTATPNRFNDFLVLQGNINIDTINKKAHIITANNRFFAFMPDNNPMILGIQQNIEIDFLNITSVQSLAFNTNTQNFEMINATQINKSNYILICSIYNNKVKLYEFIPEVYVNGVPYLESILPKNQDKYVTISNQLQNLTNPTQKTKIVLVGDSITAGQGGTDYSPTGSTIFNNYKRNENGYCWANLLKSFLESNYNCEVLNNGISGINTNFIVTNIGNLIPADTDIAVISVGTNNRTYSATNNYEQVYNLIINNFNNILNYCEKNNIKAIFQTPPQASKGNEELTNDTGKRWVHIFQIADIIKNWSGKNNLEISDIYNKLYYYCFDKGIDWATTYLSDGLHPNDKGYYLMFYKIIESLKLSPSYEKIEEPQ